MATIPTPWSKWSAKQYILAALLGTLVAIAVAAAISISLAPGHVSFSIADAKQSNVTVDPQRQLLNRFYNFTLVANNTSRRMAVRYASLVAKIWYSETSWIPAEEVNTSANLSGWRQLGDTAKVAVWADWGQYDEAANEMSLSQTTTDNNQKGTDKCSVKWPNCRVDLEAKVWFRFGLVLTRPYTISASCFPVNFNDALNSTVNCTC